MTGGVGDEDGLRQEREKNEFLLDQLTRYTLGMFKPKSFKAILAALSGCTQSTRALS